MTIFSITNEDKKIVVRAKDEMDARLLCVETTQDLAWMEEDVAPCTVLFSGGPRRILCIGEVK